MALDVSGPNATAFRDGAATRAGVRTVAVYAAMVVVPAGLGLAALLTGGLGGPRPPGAAPPGPDNLPRLLLALAVVLSVCYASARLFRRWGQPAVVGEICAGFLLGPSVLGALLPPVQAFVFPPSVWGPIDSLSQLGLIFFMFAVGYELDLGTARRRRTAVLMISHASMAIPALAGILLAFGLYGRMGGSGVSLPIFALFVGVAFSITAFPVLASIVADRRMAGHRIGQLAIACAATGDVTGWLLLLVVIAAARNGSAGHALVSLGIGAAFSVLLWRLRPALAALVSASSSGERGRLPDGATLIVVLCGAMCCALVTQAIGIHAIFGAFLFGAAVPRCDAVDRALATMRALTRTLLLPLFFVYTGLRTDLTHLGPGWSPWLWCAAVLLVAVVSKWASAGLAARATGLGTPDSLRIAALMNCRGLTELVVLSIGLDLHVISPALFTVFALMALLSTAMTNPALDLIDSLHPSTRPTQLPAEEIP